MNSLKPFTLKLIYFAVGILPLLVLALISQQNMDKSPENILWFGLFGGTLMAAFLIQNRLRKMGILNLKQIGTYIAFLIIASFAFLMIRQLL